jgi:uncharacterized protein YndB with AHSA1/START domain
MATPQQSPELKLQVRRTFNAPCAKVYAAWTERDQLGKWMCRSTDARWTRYLEYDFREGGSYRLETGLAGESTFHLHGTFRTIQPPEKLAFTWSWEKSSPGDDKWEKMDATLVTVEFHDRGNATEVVLTHEGFATDEQRARHSTGWNGCFDMLAKVLAA